MMSCNSKMSKRNKITVLVASFLASISATYFAFITFEIKEKGTQYNASFQSSSLSYSSNNWIDMLCGINLLF
jgi:hypothetical protein